MRAWRWVRSTKGDAEQASGLNSLKGPCREVDLSMLLLLSVWPAASLSEEPSLAQEPARRGFKVGGGAKSARLAGPACYVDPLEGCCATAGPACRSPHADGSSSAALTLEEDAERAQPQQPQSQLEQDRPPPPPPAPQFCLPPAVPCFVRNARCGQDEHGQAACVCSNGESRGGDGRCTVVLQAAPFDEARAGAAELGKRHSFTSTAFLLVQAGLSAGWLFLGWKTAMLLRYWGMRRSTLLVTAATCCLLAVCVLALIARSVLTTAATSREGLTQPTAWAYVALSELTFALLLSSALAVNLLWVMVCRGMLHVSQKHKAALVAVAAAFPPLTLLLLWSGQEAAHEALTFSTYCFVAGGCAPPRLALAHRWSAPKRRPARLPQTCLSQICLSQICSEVCSQAPFLPLLPSLAHNARKLKRSLEASDDLNDLSFIPPAFAAAWQLAGLCFAVLLLDCTLFVVQVLGGGGVLARVWLTSVVPADLLMARTLFVYLETQKWGDLELSLPTVPEMRLSSVHQKRSSSAAQETPPVVDVVEVPPL